MGDIKDNAIKSYIDYVGISESPQHVFELTQVVNNQDQRDELLARVFIQWYQLNPSEAETTLLENMSINEQEKFNLLVYAQEYSTIPISNKGVSDGVNVAGQ